MIDIENLSYTYPRSESPAILDITTHVEEGEFILLAGPSGAGKSTLLRCLNGLNPHYSGGIVSGGVLVDDIDVISAGPKRLSSLVGFVFQDPEAQNVLDRVEDEIAFGLENAAIPAGEMIQRIDEVMDVMELSNLRDRQISTLSGGERQRLAIASVLVMRPKIIALDEPTSQLDPQSAAELLRFLVRLNEKWHLTIIMIEHRLERVSRYADRILYLDGGYLTMDASMRDGLADLDPQRGPPLSRLYHSIGWDSMPLTTSDASHLVSLGESAENTQTERFTSPTAAVDNPLLTVHDLHFAYDENPVLNGVDLHIDPGEAVALVGRNGSGKSTLLKCLVGLLKPPLGTVKFQGVPNTGREVSDICQDIAYLPQNPDDLLFADTVSEELMTTLRNHGLVESELARSADDLLAGLDLSELAGSYPRDLSAGQRQRVALGAVVVPEPKVILLDEPTRGLDFEAKRRLIELWRRWQQDGIGLLLVTHDVELVARSCERALVMDQGRIISEGRTADVLGSNPIFQPQIARLFPGYGWMTVNDALDGLSNMPRQGSE